MVKKAAKSSEQTILRRELCAFQLLAISQARGLLLPPPSPKKFTSTELCELNAFLKNMDASLFSRCQSASRLLSYFRTDTPMQVFERILRNVFHTTCPSPINYRQLNCCRFECFVECGLATSWLLLQNLTMCKAALFLAWTNSKSRWLNLKCFNE